MVRVQGGRPPATVQCALLQVLLWLVGAGLTLGVTELKTTDISPTGIAVTVMVKVWGWVTTLVACSGEIAMDPSTQFLFAGPLLPASSSVVTVKLPPTPSMPKVGDAVTLVCPAGGVAER